MALTPKGFDGTVTEADFAKMARHFGTPYSVKDDPDLKVTAVAGQDRTVQIATGEAAAYGVLVTNDAAITLQLPTIASGTRWDLVCLRRDWQPAGGTATVTYVQGTSTKAIPAGRNANPGVIDDQPLALVQLTAGQTQPTAIVDLRSWASKVITVSDLLALPDAPLGTRAVVGSVRYKRLTSGWLAVGHDSPPCADLAMGTAPSLATDTPTVLSWDTDNKPGSMWVPSTQLQAPIAGLYIVTGNIEWPSTATGFLRLQLRINGSKYVAGNTPDATTGNSHQISVSYLWNAAAGDYIELLATQKSGGARSPIVTNGATGFAATLVRV